MHKPTHLPIPHIHIHTYIHIYKLMYMKKSLKIPTLLSQNFQSLFYLVGSGQSCVYTIKASALIPANHTLLDVADDGGRCLEGVCHRGGNDTRGPTLDPSATVYTRASIHTSLQRQQRIRKGK